MKKDRTHSTNRSNTPVLPVRLERARPRRNLPLGLVIVIDLMLFSSGLVVFALFHHVFPRDIQTSGLALPKPSFAESTATTSRTISLESSGMTDETEATTVASTQATPTETKTPSASSAPATAGSGLWSARFADRFTTGEVLTSANSYQSANLSITVKPLRADGVSYFIADIYLSGLDFFRTAFADGTYGRGLSDTVPAMAAENGAILAINGDYYGIRDQGIVIRNGELYRDTPFQDVLVLYHDGSMETYTAENLDMNRILTEGAWQAWSFGPMLLDQGQVMTQFNSDVNPKNPRTAIGYYEPGHYCFVVVDGRQTGYSDGFTLTEMSQLFYDLGCKTAYNLDGGQSSMMIFQDNLINQPYKDGRNSSDIVYLIDQS